MPSDRGRIRRFYDPFSRDYHLIYPDWEAAIGTQSRAIDRIIRKEIGPPPLNILDCACGIGTQAIGLALAGYSVHGTDLSMPALLRARREARARGARLTIGIADFRELEKATGDLYDVAICCDNAFAHMMTTRDLDRAARSIASRLRPKGLFVASIRDYDQIIRRHPPFTDLSLFRDPMGIRISFQHWNWHRDGRTYDQDLFLVRGGGDRWKLHHHRGLSHAWLRTEVSASLRKAGLQKIRWLTSARSGFKQPLVIAQAS